MNSREAAGDPHRPDPDGHGLSQQISRFGELVLAAAFFATPLTSLRVAGSVTAGDVLLAVAAVLAGLLLLLRRRLPVSSRLVWAGTGLIVVSVLLVQAFPPTDVTALAESFNGADYASSLGGAARLLIALVVLPAAVSIVVSRWSAIPMLANAFVLGVSVSCGVALLDAYAGTSIQTSLAANPAQVTGSLSLQPPRYVGLTGHPNILALTVVLALPLVICRATSAKRLVLSLPFGVLFLVAVLLTGSRGGLLGVLLVTILSLALNPRVRAVALSLDPRVLGSYAIGLAVVAVLTFAVPIQQVPRPYEAPPLVTGKWEARTGAAGGEGSEQGERPRGRQDGDGGNGGDRDRRDRGGDEDQDLTEGEIAGLNRINPGGFSAQFSDAIRRKYIDDSLEYIRNRPLVGYGFEWIETSHNIYLQLLISGSFLALLGYLLVMAGYLREAFRARSKVSGRQLDLLTAASVAVLTYLALGLVLPDIVDRYIYLPVALVLSIAALARSSPGPPSGNER